MKRSSLMLAAIAALLWSSPALAVPNTLVTAFDFSEYQDQFLVVNGMDGTGATRRPGQYTGFEGVGADFNGVLITEDFGTFFMNGEFGSTEIIVDFDLNGGVQPTLSSLQPGIAVGSAIFNSFGVDFGVGDFDNLLGLGAAGQFETLAPNALAIFGGFGDIDLAFRSSVASNPLLQAEEWFLNFAGVQQSAGQGSFDLLIEVSEDGQNYNPLTTVTLTELAEEFTVPLGDLVTPEIFTRFRFQNLGEGGPGALSPVIDNVAFLANVTVIPEPGTALLLMTGLAGLMAAGRRQA